MISVYTPNNSNETITKEISDWQGVFLAGPIAGSFDWRKAIISEMNSVIGLEDKIYILDPQGNLNKDNMMEFDNYLHQIRWENISMNRADYILFIIPKQSTKVSDYGKTTRYELGQYINTHNKNQKIYIWIDDGFSGKNYIAERVKMRRSKNIKLFKTYEDLMRTFYFDIIGKFII